MSRPPYPPPPAEDPRTQSLPAQTGQQAAASGPAPQPAQPSQPVFAGLPPQGPPPQPASQASSQASSHPAAQPPAQQPPLAPGTTGPQEYRAPQGYDPAYPAAPTGPMDWVPGFPGDRPGAQPSAPVGGHDTGRAPRVSPSRRTPADRATLTATVLGVAGLVVLELGLVLGLGVSSVWSILPTWAGFATLAALVALVPFVPSRGGLSRRQAWQVGAAGGAALLVFWVLVVLPGVASDQGFVLTAGVALSAGALWLVHDRRR